MQSPTWPFLLFCVQVQLKVKNILLQRWRHFYKIDEMFTARLIRELTVFRALGRLRRPSSMLDATRGELGSRSGLPVQH